MTYQNEIIFWGNSIRSYIYAIALFLLITSLLPKIVKLAISKLKLVSVNTPNNVDDFFVKAVSRLSVFTYWVLGIYFSLHILDIPGWLSKDLKYLLWGILTWEVIRFVNFGIYFFTQEHLDKNSLTIKSSEAMGVNTLRIFGSVLVWIIGVLLLLSNLGYDVNALITSLGIGGIAIALALQNILSDLFSSISIFFDKSIQVGDYISLGKKESGTVEKIGLKTTKIRRQNGQLLIVTNTDLTKSRLQSYHSIARRRVNINLILVYETKSEILEKVSEITQQIVEKHENAQFLHCYFKDYGDSGLIFHLAYFVNQKEFSEYIKVKNQINLDIKKIFEEKGIEFAYPTQTIYLNK